MKINIIDADSILYIVCHQKKDDPELTLEQCKLRTDEFLTSIFNLTESTHYVLYLTVGPSFRLYYYPEYKANRKGREKPKFLDQIKDYLVTKYQAKYYHELESDDCCVITRFRYMKEYPDATVFISTPDKDLLNLVGTQYDYKKNVWVETNYGRALEYFWTSMITGDTSDNVKGIPGMGIKGAEKLFKEPTATLPALVLGEYMSAWAEQDAIEEFYSTYKALKILTEHEEFEQFIISPIEIKHEETDKSS